MHLSDDDHTDQEDLSLAKAGDSIAFARLFDRHYERVYALIQRLSSGHPSSADVAQETFIRAAQKLEQIHGRFRPWIDTVALNLHRDYARSEISRTTRESSYSTETQQNFSHQTSLPESFIRISEAVAQLPDNLREIVILSYHGGYTQEEISNITGAPPGTVAWQISEAKQHLKAQLTSHEATHR